MILRKTTVTILFLLLFATLAKSQSFEPTHWYQNDLFTIGYSEELEQPLEITYTIACPNGKADRAGMNFYTIEEFHTSDDDDYYDNIWDKGHMAPAASFNCTEETLKQTFNYANSALQHQSLNRGVWRLLEEFERNASLFYTVRVRIEVLFEGELNRLDTGAVVPSGFRKTLSVGEKTIILEFPNEDTRGTDWADYIIEVKDN